MLTQPQRLAGRRNEARNVQLPPSEAGILRDFKSLPDEALLDDKQIAALVGFKRETVKGWRARGCGGPEFVYLNGRARASVAAIRKWLAGLPLASK